jgi:hypothetical protein
MLNPSGFYLLYFNKNGMLNLDSETEGSSKATKSYYSQYNDEEEVVFSSKSAC